MSNFITITVHLDKELKTEIEQFFKSKGLNLNSGVVYVLSDFLIKGQTKILTEKMDVYKLSPREKQVIKLLCQGKLVKEIADKLCLSTYTVKNHIRESYSKIGVNTRIDMFRKLTGLRTEETI